jgi:hypothetical protein
MGVFLSYPARRASTIFRRAARAAGKNPPRNPIIREKISVETIISGVIAKENASAANDPKFNVEIWKN